MQRNYLILLVIKLIIAGKIGISHYFDSREAESPMELTIEEIKGKSPKELPRYFILKNVIIPNSVSIGRTIRPDQSNIELSKALVFPVYSASDMRKNNFGSNPIPVSIFISEENPDKLLTGKTDSTEPIKPVSFLVKNNHEALSDGEIRAFKNQSLNILRDTFMLEKNFEQPRSWPLLTGLISLVLIAASLWWFLKSFVIPFRN